MTHNTQIVLPFARLSGKILQADFEGGSLSSDGGVLFLREIEAQIGVIGRDVGALDDRRDPRYTDFRHGAKIKPEFKFILTASDFMA